MASTDTAFAGSVPSRYDRYLGPLLFKPFARLIAERAQTLAPRRILETAAGTGIVTAALAEAIPDADVVATDLNPDMLEVARRQVRSGKITFELADAMDLPFADSTFDLVVCQFGIMFYPDKLTGNAEARRVLRDGGSYLLTIWDSIDRNPASKIASEAVADLFPDNPPNFFSRTPHGYSDPGRIERELQEAGFSDINIETVERRSDPISAADAAVGICQGSPLRNEIEERDPGRLDEATRAATGALHRIATGGNLDSRLTAHVVTAVK